MFKITKTTINEGLIKTELFYVDTFHISVIFFQKLYSQYPLIQISKVISPRIPSPTSVIGMALERVRSDQKKRFQRRCDMHDWNSTRKLQMIMRGFGKSLTSVIENMEQCWIGLVAIRMRASAHVEGEEAQFQNFFQIEQID